MDTAHLLLLVAALRIASTASPGPNFFACQQLFRYPINSTCTSWHSWYRYLSSDLVKPRSAWLVQGLDCDVQ